MAKQDTLSVTILNFRVEMPLLEFYNSLDDSIQHTLSTKVHRGVATTIAWQAECYKLAVSTGKPSGRQKIVEDMRRIREAVKQDDQVRCPLSVIVAQAMKLKAIRFDETVLML